MVKADYATRNDLLRDVARLASSTVGQSVAQGKLSMGSILPLSKSKVLCKMCFRMSLSGWTCFKGQC